ncbi:MAG: AMP-binding protein [Myxococcota bacterium]
MSKGALGLLSAYWPKGPARYPHVPLERVTESCIHRRAAADGERPALIAGDRQTTFAELSTQTRAAARGYLERVAPGDRVAIGLEDPIELLLCVLGAWEADLLVWLTSTAPDPADLSLFQPDLVVASEPLDAAVAQAAVSPEELLRGGATEPAGRPALRSPILALPHPQHGEVLHSHRTLLATAISFGSFFLLEPGSATALFEPPDGWLGLAALLGAWQQGGTVHARWCAPGAPSSTSVDYAVMSRAAAEERYLRPGTQPYDGRIRIGALVGIEDELSRARRRRLSRRLRAPVLTVLGRNDLGPILASHPSWFLDDAVGIPLPDVDVRPLNPVDGTELSIGWDAVEEAEMGVRGTLSPAGGELVARWLRTRWLAHVDPTGLYFLRGRVAEPNA